MLLTTTQRNHRVVLALLCSCWAAACTQPNPAYDPDPYLPGECRDGVEISETFEGYERPDRLDVLIVVDDAGDVTEMQETLAAAVDDLLEPLDEAGIDLQVAVATTDASGGPALADAGTSAEGCEDNDAVIVSDDDGDWLAAVACNVQQGEQGDVFAQPLKVIEDLRAEADALFRDDARHLVVLVTKDDDCSSDETFSGGMPRETCRDNAQALHDVNEWVERLRATVATPEGVTLAVLAGPPSDQIEEQGAVRPACSSSIGAVYPGNRLFEAVSLLGPQGLFFNLCRDDFSAPLRQIAAHVTSSNVTLCPKRPLVHEPLVVEARNDEGENEAVPLGGEAGFVFEGATEACEQGALRFSPGALHGVEAIETTYCTPGE